MNFQHSKMGSIGIRLLFWLTAISCFTGWLGSATALALGIFFAVVLGNPDSALTRKWTHPLLSLSVVGLGAGMDLGVIGRVGLQGVGYTVVGIATALLIGSLLGRWLQTERDTSLLISVGTAICGGSAIAAVAPVIRAKHHEVTVALGIVFLLNAVALLLFPVLGHQLGLSEGQFGLWSALAIHDTSSVVGATLQYGPQALAIGTTVKLARALWIVPLAFVIGLIRTAKNAAANAAGKSRKPWFILGFLLAAAVVTWQPSLRPLGQKIESVARLSLVLTLFFIGGNLNRDTLKAVGIKPFIQGILLWIVMAAGSLTAILLGWIHLAV